jgi:CheY-like chemotaxis protein
MKRIYVVDGDRLMHDLIRRSFTRQEFDLTDFGSPTDALAAVRANPPDLLISEISLNEMSGFELAASIRNGVAPALPIIFITSRPTAAAKEKARALGVRHVLKKPIDELGELSTTVRRELFFVEAVDAVRQLDELRSEFFVDLSHQLRTPITAVKLAMDGLFAQLGDVMNESQRNLARISRRNMERIVALVENQLSALQMMSDERRVCRRLVDLRRLVLELPKRPADGGKDASREPIEIITGDGIRSDGTDMRLYVFTDPEILATVVDCIVGAGPQNSRRIVRLDHDPAAACCHLDVLIEQPSAPVSTVETGARPIDGADSISSNDFEYRAYKTLLSRIGADLAIEGDGDHRWIRLRIPRYPSWNRDKDFVDPVRHVRTVGRGPDHSTEARGARTMRSVHVVKCDLGEHAGRDYLGTDNPAVRDFLGRVASVVSTTDAVVRGNQHGTIYLALCDRTQHELDRVITFLENGEVWGLAETKSRGIADGPFVWEPQRIDADGPEIDRLILDLEPV